MFLIKQILAASKTGFKTIAISRGNDKEDLVKGHLVIRSFYGLNHNIRREVEIVHTSDI